MKKYIVGGILVLLLGGYALWSASRSQTPVAADTTPSGNQMGGTSAPSETTNPGPGASGSTGGTDTGSIASSGQYKDGTYIGSIGSAAPYGQVQVKATISGGKLTDVTVVQAPHGPGHTDEVTASAFPILVKEAIAAQSAQVDIVSGATQDTEGFQQSLQSALSQAQA
jgi:uncharacterized protein with FMN-binding domain